MDKYLLKIPEDKKNKDININNVSYSKTRQPFKLMSNSYISYINDSVKKYSQKEKNGYEDIIDFISLPKTLENQLKEISKVFNIDLNNKNIYHDEKNNDKKNNSYDILLLTDNFDKIDNKHLYYYMKEEIEIPRLINSLSNNIKLLKDNKESILIIKFYGLHTKATLDLLTYFNNFFNKIYIYKPKSTSYFTKDLYFILKDLTTNSINKININNVKEIKWISSMIDNYNYNKYFNNLSNELAMNEYNYVNNAISFIDGNNYRGSEYRKYKEIQEKNDKEWIELYENVKVSI